MLMMPNVFVAVAVSVYLDASEQNYISQHSKWREMPSCIGRGVQKLHMIQEMIELASDLA